MANDADRSIEKDYYDELTRHRSITSQLSIPTGVLAIIGGGLMYLVEHFAPYSLIGWDLDVVLTYLFLPPIAAALLSFFIALYEIFRSLQFANYQTLGSAKRWNGIFEALREAASMRRQNPASISPGSKDYKEVEEEASAIFSSIRREHMSEAAAVLKEANDKREHHLSNAAKILGFSGGFLLCAGLVYGLRYVIENSVG